MRWRNALWSLPIVLVAQAPAFARMHADSPPTVQSFVFIALYIASMWWLFKRDYGVDRLALPIGIGAVASAIVLGEYVDAFLHPIVGVPPDSALPLAVAVPCVCLLSAIVQAAAAPWARYLGGKPLTAATALRIPAFWVTVIIPGLYLLLKGRVM